jgi:hypothetical protein
MADPDIIKEIRNNEPPQEIRGGIRRASKQVDLRQFPAIQRRQELNSMLLQYSCGTGEATSPSLVFRREDLNLLLQIARERDPNGNPYIRKQAIYALGQFRDLVTAELLWNVASSDLESGELREQALLTLAQVTPALARSLLQTYLTDESPRMRQAAVRALTSIGDTTTLNLLKALLKREQNVNVREYMNVAIGLLSEQAGIRDSSSREPRSHRGIRTPESEAL